MFALFVSLALLGLAAVDPVGIAAMPILLSQKHPFRRSIIFLLGSFVALISMGLIFAGGLGLVMLRFELTHPWIIPTIEMIAGIVLLIVGIYLFLRPKKKQLRTDAPESMTRWLRLGKIHLFILGALLVTFQSIVDVVFVIAMIRVEALHLPTALLLLSVMTYAIAALILQVAIIVAYGLTPPKGRLSILGKVRTLTTRYADRIVIDVSIILGGGLVINSILVMMNGPHL